MTDGDNDDAQVGCARDNMAACCSFVVFGMRAFKMSSLVVVSNSDTLVCKKKH